MDADRFDTLARSLRSAGSRRRALRGLLAGTLGLALWPLGEDVTAHDLKDKCKKKSGAAKKKCLKKAKKHSAQHANEQPPPTGGGTQPPPGPTCGTGGSCRVFVTSTTYKGNLGGLTGADAKCQQLARAASLPGTYKAWLSDNTGSPATRFFQSPRPYKLVDGTKVADTYADLIDDSLDAAILRNEFGTLVSDFFEDVWTNTRSNGTPVDANHHCLNWSSTSSTIGSRIGLFSQSDGSWTSTGTVDCNHSVGARLYCFQQS